MDKIIFKDLIEVQHNDNKIYTLLQKIEGEESRLRFFDGIKISKTEEHSKLKGEKEKITTVISNNEKNIYDSEIKISKAQNNLNNATSEKEIKASELTLNILIPQTEELENSTLVLLDEDDQIQIKIDDLNEFLDNVPESRKEIEVEVNKTIKLLNNEIDTIEKYSKSILTSIPSEISSLFQSMNKQLKYKSPLSYVENDCCKQCGFFIEVELQSQIERGNILEHCLNCSRLLAPSSCFEF